MAYETTLECSGAAFTIDSLTSDQAKEFEAEERARRKALAPMKLEEDGVTCAGGEIISEEPESLMDLLLGLAYPGHEFGPMKQRDKVQVFRETHAYTYGAPVPEGNS